MVIPALNIPLFIVSKFDFVQFLTYIQKYKITSIAGVPPILTALAKHPIVEKFDLSSVHTIGSGAAPLSSEIEKALELRMEKYGTKLRIRQGWGMTE
jgi:4-coumarate--CoA ligase